MSENLNTDAKAASKQNTSGLVKVTWICLIGAWFLLIIPFTTWFVSLPLNLTAFVLAIVVMSKGNTQGGLIPILLSLVVSPFLWYLGIAWMTISAVDSLLGTAWHGLINRKW